MVRVTKLIFVLFIATFEAFAAATIPFADKEGSQDSPLLKRYEGSFIVAYVYKSFEQFNLPVSRLEPIEGQTDRQNNKVHEPKDKITLEGAYTRLVYLLPENRTPLEVLRNYQDEIRNKGGKILFECETDACGGDPGKSSYGGGGRMSLAMYLFPREKITDPLLSNGYCATTEKIANQRYTAAEIPNRNAHVSVLTYEMKSAGRSCSAFNARTIAVVDIIESTEREQKMVTVNASEMAEKISATGSVALYGIYFDFNKADVKPESTPTLEQIYQLLLDNSTMKLLVVGHTDNVGSFEYNMDLSKNRAIAVVNALVNRYGIDSARLMPVGVSFASPVASNSSEEGQAKNRRVELVEN